jgi:hypothetical protein
VKHAWLVVAGWGVLAGCGNSHVASAAAPDVSTAATSSVPVGPGAARYDGYGATRFGVDEAAFRHAWQSELTGTPTADGSCHYLSPKWAKSPADIGFMFERGRFVRYDVGTAKETAPGGGKVGMTVEQIRALYGSGLEQSPHKYVEGAYYLRMARNRSEVLLFETDAAGKIIRWRVGVPPQIDYVEGCG